MDTNELGGSKAELSMYEDSTLDSFPSHSSGSLEYRLSRQHPGSPDSGYGTTSYTKTGKCLFFSSQQESFSQHSLSTTDEEFIDLSDLDRLEKRVDLPSDFSQLTDSPLSSHPLPTISPSTQINRRFMGALSLQFPDSSPVCREEEPTLLKRMHSFEENCTPVKKFRISDADPDTITKACKTNAQNSSTSTSAPEYATEESIKCALTISSNEPDLIGDFSKAYSLPLIDGRHPDLKAISAGTLAGLLQGDFRDAVPSFAIIDCRYPYEFEGGHIPGALNMYTFQQCKEFLEQQLSEKKRILVFHCEFSAERGPNMSRFLRKEDRHRNANLYPHLTYPELYLLEGGYKNFFEQFSKLCQPKNYVQMLHPDHADDLRFFKKKAKTWDCDTRQRGYHSRKKLMMLEPTKTSPLQW